MHVGACNRRCVQGQQEGIFREETVPEDPRRFCSIKQQAAGDLREREASTLGSEMGSKTGSGEMSPPRENALEKRSEKADSPGMEPGVLVAGAERCADTRNEGKEEARTMKVTMKVVEVTDLFRTMKGHKCTLGEAYACCFDRTEKVMKRVARSPLDRLRSFSVCVSSMYAHV